MLPIQILTFAVSTRAHADSSVNQMICTNLKRSISCEPYNLSPWRHIAFFFAVLYLLQDRIILCTSVGSFRTTYPQFGNRSFKELGDLVDHSFWIAFECKRVMFHLDVLFVFI